MSFNISRKYIEANPTKLMDWQVAEIAEDANHHPDITINYDKVKLVLSSHDVGGITRRDLNLAGKINESIPRAA